MRDRNQCCSGSVQGFTLLELVVAMFIAIVVLAATFGLLYRGQSAYSREIVVAHSNQALRAGMEMINRDLTNAGYKTPSSVAVLVNEGGADAPDQLTAIYGEGETAITSKAVGCSDDPDSGGNPCASLDQLSSIKLYSGDLNLPVTQLERAYVNDTVLLAVESSDCNEDDETGVFPLLLTEPPTVNPLEDSVTIAYEAGDVDGLNLPVGYNTEVYPDCALVGLFRIVQYRIHEDDEVAAALERRDFSVSDSWIPVSDQVDDLQVQFANMDTTDAVMGGSENGSDSGAVQVRLGFGGSPLAWGGGPASESGGGTPPSQSSQSPPSSPQGDSSSSSDSSQGSSGGGKKSTSSPSPGASGGDAPSGSTVPSGSVPTGGASTSPSSDGGPSLSTTTALRNTGGESALTGIPIAECGKTLDLPGGRYYLAKDLSAPSGTCLTITAPGVELDGRDHQIQFGGVAIVMAGGMNGNRIHDVVFRSLTYAGDRHYAAILQLTGGWNNISIDNNEFRLTNESRADLYGIRYGSGVEGSGNHIRNNLFIGSGTFRIAFSSIAWGTGSGEIHDNVARMGGTACEGRPHVFSNTEGQNVRIHNNEITVGSPERVGYPCETNVLSFYKGKGHEYYGNTITDFGGHTRTFHFDYADDVKIYENTLFQNGSDHGGVNYGIYLRYDIDGANVYGNTIDGSNCSGQCFQVFLTSGTGDLGPTNLRLHDNKLIGHHEAIRFFSASGPALQVYNNSMEWLEGSDRAQFIHFFGNNEKISGVHFAYNNITNRSGHSTVIRFSDGPGRDSYPAGPVSFCSDMVNGRQLTNDDVFDFAENNWWITRSTCDFGTPP